MIIPGLDRIAGAERQLILLAKGLRKRGWQVSVVALSGAGDAAAAELAAHGVRFLSLNMRKGLADPRGWIRFHLWLRRNRPDIVHAHLPHAAWFARWSRLAAPVRVVLDTLHSSSTGTVGRKLGYRSSNWLPDKVTAVSHAAAQAHLAAAMVSEDKLIVLPNGVDVEEWQPDPFVRSVARRELEVNAEFLWFAAGRLDPVKDYPTLLRAFSDLPEPARLVIAGAGPLESELRSLSNDLGLQSRIRFLGFQPDIRRWMQAADAFVFEVRRILNLSLKQRSEDVREQYQILANAKRIFIISQAGKQELLDIVANNRPGQPFNLDVIMRTQIDKDIRFGISEF